MNKHKSYRLGQEQIADSHETSHSAKEKRSKLLTTYIWVFREPKDCADPLPHVICNIEYLELVSINNACLHVLQGCE